MKRIVIVGGGVIGLCAAWFCREAGHEVVVLERGTRQYDGCSMGNAGLIVPSHFIPLAAPGMVSMGFKMMWNPESPFYIKPRINLELFDWGMKFIRSCTVEHVKRSAPLLRDLNFASKRLFEEFDQMPEMDFGFEKRGLVILCRTEERLHEESEVAAQARALRIPADVLSPEDTQRLDPDVNMNSAGSVYFPEDAHLSPSRFMSQLTALLEKRGVIFRWESEVKSWRRNKGNVAAALTRSGLIEGDEFVLAGGAWSPSISKELGLRLPMQPGKGYSLTVQKPAQLPKLSYIFSEARLAVTPMCGALRFGGTMEIAGFNPGTNLSRVRGIAKSVERYFAAFPPETFAGIEPWSGLRPCSPDGLPFIGRSRLFDNLTIATGHAMMGLSMGPVSGRLVAELVGGRLPSIDLTLLSPDRYLR